MNQANSNQFEFIGMSLGSLHSIIMKMHKRGPEIVMNESSDREILNIIQFNKQGTDRLICQEQAIGRLKNHFKNTILYPFTLLGVNRIWTSQEKQFIYVDHVEPSQFSIEYNSLHISLNAIQLASIILERLKSIVLNFEQMHYLSKHMQNMNNKHKDMFVVLSVPPFFTDDEKTSLLEASKLANVCVINLLQESNAISLQYLHNNKSEFAREELLQQSQLGQQQRNNNEVENQMFQQNNQFSKLIVFIDIGHSKTGIFVTHFSTNDCQVISQQYNRNLGVRDLDFVLLLFIYNEVLKIPLQAGPSDPTLKWDKNKIRLLQEIEKARKVLSSNKEYQFSMESFPSSDEDFNYLLTRAQFESILQKYGIINALLDLLSSFKQKFIDEMNLGISSVEIIGGGSRIPFVQDLIQRLFIPSGVESPSRTLHATECIAQGCTLFATFRMLPQLEQINTVQISYYNYYLKLKYDQSCDQLNNQLLFAVGDFFPSHKQVDIWIQGNIFQMWQDGLIPEFQIVQSRTTSDSQKKLSQDILVANFSMTIQAQDLQYFKSLQINEAQISLQFQCTLNENGIFEPNKQNSLMIKLQNMQKIIGIQIQKIEADIIQTKQLGGILVEMHTNENQNKQIIDVLHDLGTYINQVKHDLEEKYFILIDRKEKQQILCKIEQVQNWIQSNHEHNKQHSYQEIMEYFQQFMSFCQKILAQYDQLLNAMMAQQLVITKEEDLQTMSNFKTLAILKIQLFNEGIGDGGNALQLFGLIKKGAQRLAACIMACQVEYQISLDLGNCKLTNQGLYQIINALKTQANIKRLDLNFGSQFSKANQDSDSKQLENKFSQQALMELYGQLSMFKNLRQLSIIENQLNDASAQTLLSTVKTLRNLQSFKLVILNGQVSNNILKQFASLTSGSNERIEKLDIQYHNKQGILIQNF